MSAARRLPRRRVVAAALAALVGTVVPPILLARATALQATPPVADPRTAALAAICAKQKVPALGLAEFTSEQLLGTWVAGRRAADHETPVESGDRWHLGSCTKSMTATLLALLVERGDLQFESTLAELLPEIAPAMHADYRKVTLVDLLAHRAGVPSMTSPDPILARCSLLEGTPVVQRREFARAVLTQKPESPPRVAANYSNAGFVIAGAIAERVTGKPWEELMQTLLFDPLGMKSAGFGPPGFPDELAEPRGHGADGMPIEPGPAADNPPLLGPAGTVHASLADWAKYLQLHLRGAKGDVKVGAITLHAATFTRLHTPWASEQGVDATPYAFGWSLPKRDWAAGDHQVFTHTGSNTMWFCCCWLDPAGDWGVIATTNLGGDRAGTAADLAVQIPLKERIAARAKAEPAKK